MKWNPFGTKHLSMRCSPLWRRSPPEKWLRGYEVLSVGVLGLVGNIPLECFQNQETASGTQGGAVLFAQPSKSCRFSHPPSPCARSTAQGVSLSADSDSGGSSPPENLPPAALSWSSLFGATVLKSFRFRTMLFVPCPPISQNPPCEKRSDQSRPDRFPKIPTAYSPPPEAGR